MRRILATTPIIILVILLAAACNTAPEAVETPAATEQPQGAPTNTPEPIEGQAAPTPTETATPEPEPTATEEPAESTAQVYLVALEAAEEGEGIGCGDELVPVQVQLDPTLPPLEAALSELLAINEESYGESGLYNALYQSDLEVAGIQLEEDGTAIVALEGEVMLGGVCDTPRVLAQLEQTALQFEEVESVEFLLDGEPLRQVVAGEPVQQPTPGGPAAVDEVFMYLVLPDDAGQFGPQFGCNDTLIPVLLHVDPTVAPLTAALQQLVAVENQFYGQTELYNALNESGLRLERATVDEGVARIDLEGEVQIGGECDLPRFRAQLEQTALQFDTVDEVEIFINNEPLETITGGAQGGGFQFEPQAPGAEARVFLVAPDTGGGFGCGDSLVALQRPIETPGTPLQSALETLFTIEPSVYEPLGLYNVFAQSDLTVEGVDINGSTAEIALSGDLVLGGTCDNPRVEAQIRQTATQFENIDSVEVTLNGEPLEDVLSLR